MVPEGWTSQSLGAVVDITHGFAFDGSRFNTAGKGYRLLTPANFREEGGFRDLGVRQKHYDGPAPDGYLLDQGALLLVMTEQAPGLLGSPAMIPVGGTYLHNQRLGRVTVTRPTQASKGFLYHVFNTYHVRKLI